MREDTVQERGIYQLSPIKFLEDREDHSRRILDNCNRDYSYYKRDNRCLNTNTNDKSKSIFSRLQPTNLKNKYPKQANQLRYQYTKQNFAQYNHDKSIDKYKKDLSTHSYLKYNRDSYQEGRNPIQRLRDNQQQLKNMQLSRQRLQSKSRCNRGKSIERPSTNMERYSNLENQTELMQRLDLNRQKTNFQKSRFNIQRSSVNMQRSRPSTNMPSKQRVASILYKQRAGVKQNERGEVKRSYKDQFLDDNLYRDKEIMKAVQDKFSQKNDNRWKEENYFEKRVSHISNLNSKIRCLLDKNEKQNPLLQKIKRNDGLYEKVQDNYQNKQRYAQKYNRQGNKNNQRDLERINLPRYSQDNTLQNNKKYPQSHYQNYKYPQHHFKLQIQNTNPLDHKYNKRTQNQGKIYRNYQIQLKKEAIANNDMQMKRQINKKEIQRLQQKKKLLDLRIFQMEKKTSRYNTQRNKQDPYQSKQPQPNPIIKNQLTSQAQSNVDSIDSIQRRLKEIRKQKEDLQMQKTQRNFKIVPVKCQFGFNSQQIQFAKVLQQQLYYDTQFRIARNSFSFKRNHDQLQKLLIQQGLNPDIMLQFNSDGDGKYNYQNIKQSVSAKYLLKKWHQSRYCWFSKVRPLLEQGVNILKRIQKGEQLSKKSICNFVNQALKTFYSSGDVQLIFKRINKEI